MRKNLSKGIILALLSSLSGSYLFIFSKKALFTTSPFLFCTYYYFFSSILFSIYFLLTGKVKTFIRESKKNLKIFLTIGTIEFLSILSLFWAVKLTDPTVVSFFNNTQTLFIILWGCLFLKEKFNRLEFLGAITVICGVITITYRAGNPTLFATFLTLTSALLFSITVIIIKKFSTSIDPESFAYFRSLFIFIISIILLFGMFNTKITDFSKLKYIFLGSFFGPFLNILFYFKSLKFIEASKTSLLRSSLPIFVLFNSILILKMHPTPREILGGVIVIMGLVILVSGYERVKRVKYK